MLGQTCYKEFYENAQMEYQEVKRFIARRHSDFDFLGLRNPWNSLLSNYLLRSAPQSLSL
jgi:hypothetical protein